MISYVLSVIDRLFYERKIITTRKTTIRKSSLRDTTSMVDFKFQNESVRICLDASFSGDSNYISIGEELFKKPSEISNRPNINVSDIYSTFPEFRYEPILISIQSPYLPGKFASCNGRRLSRNDSIAGHTRNSIISKHDAFGASGEDNDVFSANRQMSVSASGRHECVGIDYIPMKTNTVFILTVGETVMTISQANTKITKSEAIVRAYAYARATILSLVSVGFDETDFVEDSLVTMFLGLFVVGMD